MASSAPGRGAKSSLVRAAVLDRWVTSRPALLYVQGQEGRYEFARAMAVHKPTGGAWHLVVKTAGKGKELKVPLEDAELCSGMVHTAVLNFFGSPIKQGLGFTRVKGFSAEKDEVDCEMLVQGEPVGNGFTAIIGELLQQAQWSRPRQSGGGAAGAGGAI